MQVLLKYHRSALYALLIAALSSCILDSDEVPDEDFCAGKIYNTSEALRLHGMYYRAYDVSSIPRYDVIFLFRNGVMRELTGLNQNEWSNIDQYLQDNFYLNDGDGSKREWGIYWLTDTTFSSEKWVYAEDHFVVYRMEGNLLDDSTFHVVDRFWCRGATHSARDWVYHYQPLTLRPDSTTTLIPD